MKTALFISEVCWNVKVRIICPAQEADVAAGQPVVVRNIAVGNKVSLGGIIVPVSHIDAGPYGA